MKLARVVGTVVATVKDPALEGKKILIVKPMRRDGTPYGQALLALDSVGAGAGEAVYFVRGKEAAFPWDPEPVPTDCSIVGILDRENFLTNK